MVSLVHAGASLTGGASEGSIGLLLEFDIEVILPINGDRLVDEPEVGVDKGEDEQSTADQQLGMQIVEFVVQIVHLVGVLLGVVLVGRVENEPFADLEHGGQHVHVLFERQFEVLLVQQGAFAELLVAR